MLDGVLEGLFSCYRDVEEATTEVGIYHVLQVNALEYAIVLQVMAVNHQRGGLCALEDSYGVSIGVVVADRCDLLVQVVAFVVG